MKMNVIVLIGGISANSLNKRLFAAVENLPGAEKFDFTVFDIATLPFFSQDIENIPPDSVIALRKLAAASDGVLIVTPEYNRSIPGVLKNALDWGSRHPGANVWAHKPTAIMGAATGAIGTFGAQQHLRNICSWLDMRVMNQPTVYFNASTGMTDADGKPTSDGDRLSDGSAAFLDSFLVAFAKWIHLLKAESSL